MGRRRHDRRHARKGPRYAVGLEAQARREARERDAQLKGSRYAVATRMCTQASRVVERSGVADRAEQTLATTVGAPRRLTYRAMLNLLVLCALTQGGSMVLQGAYDRVYRALTAHQRELMGLPERMTYGQFWKTFDKVARSVGWDVDEETGEVTTRALGRTVDEVASDLARAGIPSSCPPTATAAEDGTAHESSFHRKSRSADGLPDVPACQLPVETDERAPDVSTPGFPRIGPDGRLRHTHDPDVTEGYRGKKQGQTAIYLGRELHLIADVPDLGSEPVPAFIRAASIRGAGDDRLEGGLTALDNLGYTPEVLLADRGYSYLTAWGEHLVRRGIRQTIDLHPNQRKVSPGPLPGTLWVDGTLASEALPTRLRSLAAYQRGMTRGDRHELASTYDQRLPYLYTPMGSPDGRTGRLRFRGPAVTGRVRCPNTPSSMRLRPTRRRPTTACRPGVECGCGRTITLTPEEYGRTFQTAPYGTTRWLASYHRRSAIESANGEIRRNRLSVGKYSILVRGNRRYSLLMGCLLAAVNLLMAEDWFCTPWDQLDEAQTPPPRFVRREREDTTTHRLLRHMMRPDDDEDS